MNYLIRGVIILILAVMAIICVNYVQSDYSECPQDTISASKPKDYRKPIKTKYIWKDSKGNKYPIYISSNGSCFVIKTSFKTLGKEYKNYLDPEISKQICKNYGVEYKE